MTEIRFTCDQPLQMHRKKSDQLLSSQFVCKPGGDPSYVEIKGM